MGLFGDIAAIQRRIAAIVGNAAPERVPRARTFDAVLARVLPPSGIGRLVTQNAAARHVDPALIASVIANESAFDAHATSAAGAQGLMQLMPRTAAALGVKNPYDAAQNVAGGTRYLKALLDRFGGDERLAVAAYNAGPGAVEKYGDVPPYAETQTYVARVLGSLDRYRAQP